MDPSANLSDSRPESLNTVSYTHTEEMEPPLSHKPAYVESLVYKRHAEAVTDLPKYVPKPLSCPNKSVSKRPGNETMADLDCLGSLTPNCSLAECRFSEDHTNLQPTLSAVNCHPKKSDLSFHKYSAPSTSDSPQVTHSLPSTPSCHTVPSKTLQDICHEELAVHYSLKQDSSTSEVRRIVSLASISMTDDQSDQFGPEAVLTPHSNNTDPSTLLSDPSSDLTESDCAVEPLFIFESDTQDNPSSQSNPALNHQLSSDRPSAFPLILYSTRIHSEHILPVAGTQSHNHLFTKVDMDLDSEPCTQRIGLEPPTGSADAGKDGTPVSGAVSTSHVNSQAVQSNNPIDLWMDACQYLSGEDKGAGNPYSEGIILDLWGSSAVSEEEVGAEIPNLPWPCPSEERETSGYPSVEEGGDAFRRVSSGDIGGVWGPPHVERWASVDSWETALSDWAAIMASPPEEITAAFTEIGAEIDALTEALARDSEARSAMASPGKTPGQVSTQEDPLDRGDTGVSDFYPQTQMPTPSLESQPRPDQTLESQPRPDQTVESQPRPDQILESQPRPDQMLESQPRPDQTLESQPKPDQRLESHPRPDRTLESQPRPGLCISPGGSSLLGEAVAATTSPNTPRDLSVNKDLMEVRPEDSKATPGEVNNHAGELKSTLDQDLVYLVDMHSSSTVPCVKLTSLGECSTDVRQTAASIPGFLGIPALLEDSGLDLCQFQGYVGPKDRDGDTSQEEDVVLLHIEEDWDEDVEKESTPPELNFEGPHGGNVYKVTEEDAVSQQESSVEDRDSRRNASELTDSYLTAGESETVESEAVESEAAGGVFYHFGDATHALRNAGALPGDVEVGQLGNADKHTSHDTALHQNVLSSEAPHSAMPAVPLPTGGSVLSVTVNGLEGDQDCVQAEVFDDNKEPSCPRTKTCVPLPALEVTGKSPPQSRSENKAETTNGTEHSNSEEEIKEVLSVCAEDGGLLNRGSSDLGNASGDRFTTECNTLDITRDIDALRRDPANLVTSVPGGRFVHSEKSHVAYITLELVDPFSPKATKDTAPPGLQNGVWTGAGRETELTMPHRTHRSSLDFKTRPKKDKCATGPHPAAPACKRQESLAAHVPVQQPPKAQDSHTKHDPFPPRQEGKEDAAATTAAATASKGPVAGDAPVAKSHSKKKKKHVTQNATVVKSETEAPSATEENGAKQKPMEGKISIFEAKFGTKIGKTKDKAAVISGKLDGVQAEVQKKHPEAKGLPVTEPQSRGAHVKLPPAPLTNQLNDDAVKRRRLSEKKFGKMVSALESKLNKAEVSVAPKREEAKASVDSTRRRAYNEVVKQKAPREEPKVVKVIQAESVSGDPLSLCLWCQFCAASDHTVTWSREGSTLSELKRSGGDESRVSVTITKASHQDLGKYQCVLTSLHGSLSLDFLLTYEVLSEIVVLETPKNIPSSPVDIVGNEENVHCSRLLFKEDFLSQQYFGENQAASIVTEAVHFGEGMHRRAFRTKLQAGLVPQLEPGNTCVLKVHNSISYGTKDNDELVQKNFNLAVEECQVQNTAREYIKAYTTVAQSAEAFGEVPEIIPIYLVHRPSNEIPYATLEEELIGEFVKYSVRDGKEINLKRRDSEAGQKCCAFQHWVYDKTDGNLLVTDMQGVGMRLTDVGIATCKKGYKGFRGNCATSFIDQFKALHMCNKYCEILGLASLQPKPKKTFSAPKPKPQPSSAIPKKKTFGPTVKGKS